MQNPIELENLFREYVENLPQLAHDGVISVDLKFLHDNNLLEDFESDSSDPDDITQYFHVIESAEKVTLFNDQFAIWIIPRMEQDNPITYVMIALLNQENSNLEIVFTTSGVYNTPKYVLKVLQFFLLDMIETEATITAIEKNK
ncbi:MAG TPA: hypothetical protein P5048_02035 [Chlamydiales bacterium]|nr:hypothetical protein [Chlamydiales bacterium]